MRLFTSFTTDSRSATMELGAVIEANELTRTNHVCIIAMEGRTDASSADLIETVAEKLEGVSKAKVRSVHYQ